MMLRSRNRCIAAFPGASVTANLMLIDKAHAQVDGLNQCFKLIATSGVQRNK